MNRRERTKRTDKSDSSDDPGPEKKQQLSIAATAIEQYRNHVATSFPGKINEILEKLKLYLPDGVTMIRDELLPGDSEAKEHAATFVDFDPTGCSFRICRLRKGDLEIGVDIEAEGIYRSDLVIFFDTEEYQQNFWHTRFETRRFSRVTGLSYDPFSCRKFSRVAGLPYDASSYITELFQRISERKNKLTACAKSAT